MEHHNFVRIAGGLLPIAVCVGIHTGTLMLGTIGESERMDGTVIADAVNLASRVESLTKLYGAKILMTDATKSELVSERETPARFLGRVAVKGKQTGVGVFEVIASDAEALQTAKAASARTFDAAVRAFGAGDFDEAIAGFTRVLGHNPNDRAATYFQARCAELAADPNAWDGVDTMTVK